MQALRPFRPAPLYAAAGLVPALLALTLPAFSRHDPVSTSAALPQTPQQVADTLDSIIQPRFQDLTAGNFGVSRLVPAVPGHKSIGYLGYFRTQTPAETALLARADAALRAYIIAFLHCVPVPQITANSGFTSQFRTITVKGTSEGYSSEYLTATEPLLRDAAMKALPAAEKGASVQAVSGPWILFLRPVRATQAACLTCHTTAKRGDTLGVMVYAVDKNTIHLPLKSSMVGPQ